MSQQVDHVVNARRSDLVIGLSSVICLTLKGECTMSELGSVLEIILKISAGFASLAGVSALVAVIVQVLKLVGVARDDTAGKWAAGFNLVAFLALVSFGIFQPQITMEVLDGYAAQIAVIALF